MSAESNSGGGIGVCGLLLVAFIVLKLCGVIDWPWVWVLAPFWLPLGLALVIIGAVVLIELLASRD